VLLLNLSKQIDAKANPVILAFSNLRIFAFYLNLSMIYSYNLIINNKSLILGFLLILRSCLSTDWRKIVTTENTENTEEREKV